MRLGLLFGGRSVEHDVSIQSARSILDALDRDRYEVSLIAVDHHGRWRELPGPEIPTPLEPLGPEILLPPHPDRTANHRLIRSTEGNPAASPSGAGDTDLILDILFPILHGSGGEDGALQGLLELAEIAYVGSGVLGSALQMDKDVAKKLLGAAQLPVVPWLPLRHDELRGHGLDTSISKIENKFGYPLFVKPANSGSSVGINRATQREELRASLEEALRFDDKVMVEQAIDAREVEVAILGNEKPEASVVGEIISGHAFYDYEAKYEDDSTQLLIPAPLSDDESQRVRDLAIRAFQVLEAEGMARVDFLIDKQSGQPYLNEVNSLPGFTQVSMYPRLWEASGLAYPDLLDRLVSLGLQRRDRRSGLERTYLPHQRR